MTNSHGCSRGSGRRGRAGRRAPTRWPRWARSPRRSGAARVEWPSVPGGEAAAVYKIFRWGRLWAGRFPEVGAWARSYRGVLAEPPWCGLVQHKGLLATMWELAPGHPGLLPTVLEGPGALPDGGRAGWARKSFHGISGYEVVLETPDGRFGAMENGEVASVWQALCRAPRTDGLYAILSTFLVGGRYAGAVIREDDTIISYDDIVTPLATDG